MQQPAARRGGKSADQIDAAAIGRLPAEVECAPTWSSKATGHSSATAPRQLPAEQFSKPWAGQPTSWRGDAAASGSNGPVLGGIRTLGRTSADAGPTASAGAMPHEPAAAPASRPEHGRAPDQPSEEVCAETWLIDISSICAIGYAGCRSTSAPCMTAQSFASADLIVRLQEWPVHRFQRLMAQRQQEAQQADHGPAIPRPPLHPAAAQQLAPAKSITHVAAPSAICSNTLPVHRQAFSSNGSMLLSEPTAEFSRPLQQLPNDRSAINSGGCLPSNRCLSSFAPAASQQDPAPQQQRGATGTAVQPNMREQQLAAESETQTPAGHSRSDGTWHRQHAAGTGTHNGGGSRQRGTGSPWPWERCSDRDRGSGDEAWPLQGIGSGSGNRKQEEQKQQQQGGAAKGTGTAGGQQPGAAGCAWGPWLDDSKSSHPKTADGQQQGGAGGAWGAWLDDGMPAGETALTGDMPVAAEQAGNVWAVATKAAPKQPHKSQLVLGL